MPALDTLWQFVAAHAYSIPFENVDVLLGRGISLTDDVERKLGQDCRGGYCFDQNSLLLRALTALGFTASPLSARVRLKAPRDVMPARTHLFVRVDVDSVPWLADVGVGGLTPTAPIRLDILDEEHATPHEPRRIVREDGLPVPRYFHQAKLGAVWSGVYEFTREEMPVIDREVGNWWTSTSPQSRFRYGLMAALARRDGTRVSILNREFTHRSRADALERFNFEDTDHLLDVLAERFRLLLPADTALTFP